ncbi:MAG TPA: hypothetical protein VJL89_02385 [Thermodesulfovibrionia bacterium]|nr:hypothetical protein [Thermodesulfovibrionia bacterium]
MQYPLEEKIGHPDLLVGRTEEFEKFQKWIDFIPKKGSKSRVLLARRKSGKTTFVQRIFNKLWSENGAVIPFYFAFEENKIWFPVFAMNYFQTFASHVISFLERNEEMVRTLLTFEEIRDYGKSESVNFFVKSVNDILHYQEMEYNDLMWKIAYYAPHNFAASYDKRILVIFDEFQYLAQHVYRDEKLGGKPDESMPGSFHNVVESKIAPMLVTGSYVGWLLDIAGKYLEAGRLTNIRMSPYLKPEEGLQAVFKYAEFYEEPLTNETAALINRLCMSDPFFISCVIQSNYENRDLTTEQGVIETVNYEIADRKSEMSETWNEYIQLTLSKINDIHAKNMLLHLSKHNDRIWTPKQLKDALKLDISVEEIRRKLILMVEADVIEQGVADIDFQGLQDGTLNLVLRNRFEKEITGYAPDLKKEFHEQTEELRKDKQRLQGMLNNVSGKMAEYQLVVAFLSLKRFSLSAFFSDISDNTELIIIDVRQRFPVQREDGKNMEIDIVAESNCGRVVLIEVKKRQEKSGINLVEEFLKKVNIYVRNFPEKTVLTAFLSLGGFTEEARAFCKSKGIGMAEKIQFM